jgi:hypothetical protein
MTPDAANRARTLRNVRLMLYAWRGARVNLGFPDNHDELNEVIRDVELLIDELETSRT